eukprot:TRINITY_DN2313_c0_g1_i1.p1 TRINITY_DN2313_c0_g1~~TRINITY_DN2313_c0_g1_i1.p1  ORF type:complete len:388 (-),score=53.81 TRINITY_DN2313_c0_g1_i1:410-1573(-)
MKSEVMEKSSRFFIPVCVCILSKYPYISIFTKMLEQMSSGKLLNLSLPLEVYVHYLVHAIPAIPRAFYKLQVQVADNEMIDIVPPMPNALPMCDINFCPLARSLAPDDILKVMNYIVLEHSVLFVSSKIELLGITIQSVLALIFPFEYRLICIPLLPQKLIDILQTNCPFIIGMHRSLFDHTKRYISSTTLIIDLDNNELILQEHKWLQFSTLNYKGQVKAAELPEHEKKKLLTRITPVLTKLKASNELDTSKAKYSERETLVSKLRDAFLLFFVSCLKAYGSFIERKNGMYKVDYKKLKQSVKEDYCLFLAQFTDTCMFRHWLCKRYNPKDHVSAYDMLFFDESVIAKLNRTAPIASVKQVRFEYNIADSFPGRKEAFRYTNSRDH